jgi:phosphatidate cytidylyltransferase
VALGAACAAAFWAGWGAAAPAAAWWGATLVWVLGGAWLLRSGTVAWPQLPKGLRIAIGLVLLWTAWLALVNAKAIGVNFILSVFCLVWAADIAAYFGGRAFGRRKLAPSISPGKSWEGVWSGMVGALLLAVLWLLVERALAVDSKSLYDALRDRFNVVVIALGVMFLAAMSVVGDLFESLVKRSAGAKDSSRLLPGHGGVLDRIDALLPVFPIALAMASI